MKRVDVHYRNYDLRPPNNENFSLDDLSADIHAYRTNDPIGLHHPELSYAGVNVGPASPRRVAIARERGAQPRTEIDLS